ncbi:hypothetical protein CsatB_028905 [Cannabis sativa]
MGRNKNAVLGYLKERVRKGVQNWDSKFLSKAGKEVLIKTVAQALPSYAMSVFLLPLDISHGMEQHMAKFWWKTSNTKEKGIHWMSSDKLCQHKSMGGLSFRNLRDHNLALLGKQGWRLLTNNDSLVARIYKARYYPNGTYLTASLGNNPSFIWRSIFEAQRVVQMGARWKVGSDSKVAVTGEPWLLFGDNPCITSIHPALSTAVVGNLMEIGGERWDLELLQDLFNSRDVAAISSVPILQHPAADELVWHHELSGNYSVKSAFNLIQKEKGAWNSIEASEFWNELWRLKIPPKIKNLIWRGGTNCLSTKVQLITKRVDVDSLCPVCGLHNETIMHALVYCSTASQYWEKAAIQLPLQQGTSFVDWCVTVFNTATVETRKLFCTLCWALWSARNDKVWKNKDTNASFIFAFATCYLDQWKSAQTPYLETSRTGLLAGDGLDRWCAPNVNEIKVNVDASIFGSSQDYGYGIVARDEHGYMLEGVSRLCHGNIRPELAEAIGVREALSWIKDKQWLNVILETNCLVVVQAIRSPIHRISFFGDVIKECQNLLMRLRGVTISFVKRSANLVAHVIAKAAISYPDRIFSMGDVPTDMLPFLVAEFEV